MPHIQGTDIRIDRAVLDAPRTRPDEIALERTDDSILNDSKLGIVHTTITLGADLTLVADVDNAAKGGGAKVFEFPTGYIYIHKARVTGTLTTDVADLTSTAGEIGLGIVVATGAVAVLGGTATFESILEGGIPALGNFTAGNDLDFSAVGGPRNALLGGFSAEVPVFLNCASTWGDVAAAADVIAKAGTTIEIWWSRHEP